MKKTFTILGLLFVLLLFGCDKTKPEDLTITIAGIESAEVMVNDEFNVKEGVTALGSDGVDYTNKLKITSLAGITDGMLNTSKVGRTQIYYDIEIEEKDFFLRKVRDVNITAKPKEEGVFLANGDFSEGTTYWEIYDGAGKMALEVVEGILEVDITAVGDTWEPRFSQMEIPFEKGTAYKVSFKAKADADKKVHLQAGELLDFDPYWNDFKPGQVEVRTITTEWAEYEFTFMMNQENHNGGIILEFGKGGVGDDVLTKVYIEWIKIEPTVLGADEDAPVITVSDKEFLVGTVVNLESLISVYDVRDGEIAFADLEIVIKKDGEVVTEIDSSEEGVYVISVTASDEAGNKDTKTFEIKFVEMTFLEGNFVVNGDFSKAIDDENPEWNLWFADWDGTAVTSGIVDGAYVVDATATGGANWSIQIFQNDMFELEEGKSYRLSFDLEATKVRDFWVEVSDGAKEGAEFQYLNEKATTALETSRYEFLFTVTAPIEESKLIFMFGTGEAAKFTFDNVKIEEADNEIFKNGNFDLLGGWEVFYNDWEGSAATYEVEDGFITINFETLAAMGETWKLQLNQDVEGAYLEFEPNKEYTLSFKAQANVDWTVEQLIAIPNVWVNLIGADDANIVVTNELKTFKTKFTTPADVDGKHTFKFQFGSGVADFDDVEFIKFGDLSLKDENGKELFRNAALDEVKYFTFDHAGGGEDIGKMVYDSANKHAVITTDRVGDVPYIPHMYQIFDVLSPGTYEFKMVLSSSVARTLRLNFTVPSEGYRSLVEGDFKDIIFEEVDEDVVVKLIFEIDRVIEGLKFELDFGKIDEETDAPGVFTIKQVLFYQNFN